ncbi:very-long-chain (3R)-3-hydroxyacyl-CoA dehydratase 1-like isoform X1 [Petromyzon marinus]|uniref:Very-long-chain (3R)-3-hydroxyacyl-CoA dehydratase n=1 Tax=Petromyzon marinus TaxID=7757 RepID=A0AAJ7T9Y8_PETMA|nr:very-long-chain (3R)-3-hydroxyacyl-CoA dehydratase 1-like isoform X1 [Petromyzon marinus]
MAAEVEGAEAAQPAASAEKKKKLQQQQKAAEASRGKASFLATAWLILYNTVMTAGWLVLAVSMARYGLAKGSNRGLYRSIEKTLKIFQTGALLEVVHCATGIVPSSAVLTAFQVSSRVFLVWAVTDSVKPVQNEYSVLIYLSAWTLTEIVRYSFYTFSLLKYLPRAIKWASLPTALLPHDVPTQESSWRAESQRIVTGHNLYTSRDETSGTRLSKEDATQMGSMSSLIKYKSTMMRQLQSASFNQKLSVHLPNTSSRLQDKALPIRFQIPPS